MKIPSLRVTVSIWDLSQLSTSCISYQPVYQERLSTSVSCIYIHTQKQLFEINYKLLEELDSLSKAWSRLYEMRE